MLTLAASPAATADPQAGIEELISLITGFELDVDSEFVLIGRNRVGFLRIIEFLQNVLGTRTPAVGLDGDERGRIVVGLKKVIGLQSGGEIFHHQLRILSTRLVGQQTVHDGERSDLQSQCPCPIGRPIVLR